MGFITQDFYSSKQFNKILLVVLSIPLLNVIATIAVGHISGGVLNPGTLRAIIIYFMFIYIFNKGLPFNKLLIPTYLLILVFLVSCLLSKNFFESFYVYLRFVIASMLFVVSYFAIRTKEHLLKFNRVIIIVLAIQVVYVILANVFKFGSSDYLEGSFFFGETGVNITKEMGVAVFIAPVFFSLETNKRFKIIAAGLFIAALIIIVVGLKRAALLSVAMGVFVYFLTSPRKLRAVRIFLFGALFLALLSPYFIDVIYERYEARSK